MSVMTVEKETAIAATLIKGHAITHEKLNDITERLKKRIPTLMIEEAMTGYGAYLELKSRNTRENSKTVLSKFLEYFSGRNVGEIYAKEVKMFLAGSYSQVAPSTLDLRVRQLSSFFEWCNLYLAEEGSPQFHNPCKLIKTKKVKAKRPDMLTAHSVAKIMDNSLDSMVWLAVAVMATGGLRISEFLKLRPCDVSEDGRRLVLIQPKSGKEVETAVVPTWVGKRLLEEMDHHGETSYMFLGVPYSWEASEKARLSLTKRIKRAAQRGAVKATAHNLRAFCATFWTRAEEYGMLDYVLRHSGVKANGVQVLSSLDSRYVARLTDEEAMSRQDEHMRKGVFL